MEYSFPRKKIEILKKFLFQIRTRKKKWNFSQEQKGRKILFWQSWNGKFWLASRSSEGWAGSLAPWQPTWWVGGLPGSFAGQLPDCLPVSIGQLSSWLRAHEPKQPPRWAAGEPGEVGGPGKQAGWPACLLGFRQTFWQSQHVPVEYLSLAESMFSGGENYSIIKLLTRFKLHWLNHHHHLFLCCMSLPSKYQLPNLPNLVRSDKVTAQGDVEVLQLFSEVCHSQLYK